MDRRTRRLLSAKEWREKDLHRQEGGHSYKFSSFGYVTFTNPSKRVPIRTRRPRARRTPTTTQTLHADRMISLKILPPLPHPTLTLTT